MKHGPIGASRSSADIPNDQKKQLDRDADAFEIRMKNYRRVLDMEPSVAALKPTVVRGFLVNYPSSGHHVADYLFPMSFVNQVDAVLETMWQANHEFWVGTPKKVAASIKKLMEDTADVLEKADHYEWVKWGAAVAATVVGGVIVHRVTRK